VSVGQIAAVCSGPWRGRGELVAQALWLLNAQGLTLRDRGATHGWKLTAVGAALCRVSRTLPDSSRATTRGRLAAHDRALASRPATRREPRASVSSRRGSRKPALGWI
jgi:hypothetical protein